MMTLRERTKRAILEQLDNSLFTKDGFDCRFNEDDLTVSIKFNDYDQYYFKVNERSNHKWSVTQKPGDLFDEEQINSFDTFEVAIKEIDKWINHIFEELTLRSGDRPNVFDNLRDRLNEQADMLPEPERPFSKAEAAVWEQRLDSFVAQLQQLQKDQKVSFSLVENLQSEVNKLKYQP